MRYYHKTLVCPAAPGPGAALNITALDRGVAVYLTRTGGTFQVEVSFNGTNFVPYGTAMVLTGILVIPFAVHSIRMNSTAAGVATAAVTGYQS